MIKKSLLKIFIFTVLLVMTGCFFTDEDSNDNNEVKSKWNLGDLSVDSNGKLWVADGSEKDPGIYIIDPSDDSIEEGPISTGLNPIKIAFCGDSAVIATSASDWSSGAHSVIPIAAPRTAANNLLPSGSDVSVVAYGDYFYRIERFMADNVTKFSIDSPGTPIFQVSAMDDNDGSEGENIFSSNPYTIIFDNASYAFLIRFNSKRAWLVDPSVSNADDFHTVDEEIDFSGYSDSDGLPEMNSGVIVGDSLFVSLQLITQNPYPTPWTYDNLSQIVVLNKNTLAEEDVIELTVRNPQEITHFDNYLYVPAAGDYNGNYGGIEKINIADANDAVVISSGSIVMDVAIVSSTKGYFIEYVTYGDSRLRSFNPTTGVVDDGNAANIGSGD